MIKKIVKREDFYFFILDSSQNNVFDNMPILNENGELIGVLIHKINNGIKYYTALPSSEIEALVNNSMNETITFSNFQTILQADIIIISNQHEALFEVYESLLEISKDCLKLAEFALENNLIDQTNIIHDINYLLISTSLADLSQLLVAIKFYSNIYSCTNRDDLREYLRGIIAHTKQNFQERNKSIQEYLTLVDKESLIRLITEYQQELDNTLKILDEILASMNE